MPLANEHLEYPRRRYGMDHDAYDWSMMQTRAPLRWPGGQSVALWINLSLQHFPLDGQGKPFKAPGAMQTAYPDLRHYSLREHGNRIGVFRVLSALRARGLRASFALNGVLAERYPRLLELVAMHPGEWLGHGWDMDMLPHAGWSSEQESDWIARSIAAIQPYAPGPIRGWLSPARQQSPNSAALLRAHPLAFCVDWVNDELPYRYRTSAGELEILPLSSELEDRFVLLNNLHSEQSWCEQVCDAFDALQAEGNRQGGRILALSLHPWVIGHAHRIGKLEQALDYILAKAAASGGVWNALPSEILAAASAR